MYTMLMFTIFSLWTPLHMSELLMWVSFWCIQPFWPIFLKFSNPSLIAVVWLNSKLFKNQKNLKWFTRKWCQLKLCWCCCISPQLSTKIHQPCSMLYHHLSPYSLGLYLVQNDFGSPSCDWNKWYIKFGGICIRTSLFAPLDHYQKRVYD